MDCVKVMEPDDSKVKVGRKKTLGALGAFAPATMNFQRPEDSRKEGYLVKKGHNRRNWQRRYFVLFEGILMYFGSQQKFEKVKDKLERTPFKPDKLAPKGWLRLREYSLHMDDREKYRRMFYLQGEDSKKSYMVRADDEKEFGDWKQVMELLAQKKVLRKATGVFSDVESDVGPDRVDSAYGGGISDGPASPALTRLAPRQRPDQGSSSSGGSFSISDSRDMPSGRS